MPRFKTQILYGKNEHVQAKRAAACLHKQLPSHVGISVRATRWPGSSDIAGYSVNVSAEGKRAYAKLRDKLLPEAERKCKL